jgi:hypothetical protein
MALAERFFCLRSYVPAMKEDYHVSWALAFSRSNISHKLLLAGLVAESLNTPSSCLFLVPASAHGF